MRSIGKGSGGSNAGYTSRTHGSSLREMGSPLDQERAASMADEGGVAGAHTDALMQTRAVPHHSSALVTQRNLRKILPWAALVTGLAAGLAGAIWAWRRSHDY
ncbi:MAG TPA: hypothetical protein VFN67_24470 [Polyangiales bacterium]|nr:hypothetical protein [Polyangiales bacterium]